MQRKKHVLIPIDFSNTSLDTVETTRDLSFPDMEITLLHVYNPIQLHGPKTRDIALSPTELSKKFEKDLFDRLKKIRETRLQGFNKVFLFVEVSRYPDKAICQFAARKRVDLIIVTTHKKTNCSGAAMGSVADGVVRKAPCAVLVMRMGRYHIDQFIESERYVVEHRNLNVSL